MFNQRLKQDRTWQQISTAAQDSGAHVLYDFSRITAPSPIFLFTDKIRKPFPIEWCKELPPHDRSFGYRGLSNLIQLLKITSLSKLLRKDRHMKLGRTAIIIIEKTLMMPAVDRVSVEFNV